MFEKLIDDSGAIRDPGPVNDWLCNASTATTFDFALKTRYTARKIEDLTVAERPFLAKVAKDEDFVGVAEVVPMTYANPQGIAGSTRAVAQTNATNVTGAKFTVTNGKYHGSVDIGDEVLKKSRKNPGAFLQNQTAETDGLYEQMAENLSIYIWGNGGNALGRRASISTNTVTLTNAHEARSFEVGMTVVASANDGSDPSHVLRAGSTTVTAVDPALGTVTLASAAAITSFANNDYLFRQGDFFGDQAVVVVKGIQLQIYGAAAPPALYGMTRTAEPIRLSGCYVPSADVTGAGIEERIQKLGAYMSGRFKAKVPQDGYLHPEDWQSLAISLQNRGQRSLTDESTRFGFKYLEVITGGQTQKIYAERHCPKGTYFALGMKYWTLASLEKLIAPLNADGLTMLRKGTTDDYEFRLICYPALYTNAPLHNGRVTLT
jgi:hypothetical protein